MGKYREPIGHTCPDIDVVVEIAKEIKSICKSPDNDDHEYNYRCISDLTSDIILQIEDLRSSNSTLRDWGSDINDELEEVEKDRDDLQQRIEELEDDLQQRIEELEDEISDLNYQIKELQEN